MDDDTWNFMDEVVNSLPNTKGFSPRTTYGFCDGSEKIEKLCSENLCEQREFSSLLYRSHSDTSFYPCTATLGKEYRVISFSSNCNPGILKTGICVPPRTNGAGKIVFVDSGAEYIYTDMADIAAAVIGKTEEDMMWKTGGENFLEFKKKIFEEMIGFAAEEMLARSNLILSKLPPEKEKCIDLQTEFRDSMNIILQILDLGVENDAMAQAFSTQMDSSGALWQDLINNGCEYIG